MQIILYGIPLCFIAYESEPTCLRECKSLSTGLFPFKRLEKNNGKIDCTCKW